MGNIIKSTDELKVRKVFNHKYKCKCGREVTFITDEKNPKRKSMCWDCAKKEGMEL